ncbi:MAG: hypothetical protein Q4G11_07210 [Gallicola sp.]|nr:hypothetical protein [Gallicola sp.]
MIFSTKETLIRIYNSIDYDELKSLSFENELFEYLFVIAQRSMIGDGYESKMTAVSVQNNIQASSSEEYADRSLP